MATDEETTEKTAEEKEKEAQQEATLMLARAIHESCVDSKLARETMEAAGTAVLEGTPWTKLTPKVKIAWMRVSILLQGKLPRYEIPPTQGDRPKDPPSDKRDADTPPANGARKEED